MSDSKFPKQPCQFFARNQCRFGDRCKYSHDPTTPTRNNAGDRNTRRQTTPGSNTPGSARTQDNSLQEWKQIVRQGSYSPNRTTCDRFFTLAVKLLDGDPGSVQEAIRLLATENGLAFIRLLVDVHIPNATYNFAKQDIWLKQVQPLFTIVTHSAVANSAVLEQQVATIYNFMQGIGSRRLKVLFDLSVTVLRLGAVDGMPQTSSTDSATSQMAITETILAMLCKMIDCNTSNIIDETFKAAVHQMDTILKGLKDTSNNHLMLQSQKSIRYINQRLGVGDELPVSETFVVPSISSRAEFVLPQDLPGRLSTSGPRHDNDHANIVDISIMPTHEEIASTRAEYLPNCDPSSFHRPGVLGRLDREFRLLREDTVGQLRDGVREVIEALQSATKPQRRKGQNMRVHTYHDAEILDVSFEVLRGLDLLLSFAQPTKIATSKGRQEWWSQTKRLQPGALVCIVSSDGSALFCVVSENNIPTNDAKAKAYQKDKKSKQKEGQQESTENDPSLTSDPTYAYVHLHIAELNDSSVQQALCWYRDIRPNKKCCLVEFPGVLLASFQNTLEALQRMSRANNLPFSDLIAPVRSSLNVTEIPPPQYSTKPGFYFDLSCLSQDGTRLRCAPTERQDPGRIAKHTTLDETQSVALINGLTRGLALIQGPPGTGKSYTCEKLIKVLLANKEKAKLGPIICVCYTNHALDQLLEHILDDGVKQIIRIGSRSKSERLEALNLRHITRNAERTRFEKGALWNIRESLNEHESSATIYLQDLRYCFDRPALEAYLETNHPQHYHSIFGVKTDDEGFQEVQRKNGIQALNQWLSGGQIPKVASGSRRIEHLVDLPLHNMDRLERHRLYKHWQREIRDPIIRNLLSTHREYTITNQQRRNTIQEVDLRCLQEADVIGVTTTGLARNLDLLNRLGCKIMICEEAGEVLEAHTLTALLPSIEHSILIGDHLQLRPQIQNYDLSSANPRGGKYSLDVSLFERLVHPTNTNGQRLPFDTLQTQRRMHPSISQLIRETLYPELVDGGAVAEYPEVFGMRRRLFWLQHNVLEDGAQQKDLASTSHTNKFEVDMTVAVVQHLVRQGTYAADDIAVITPYLGQLFRIRAAMQSMFEISVSDRDLEELSALEAEQASEQLKLPAIAATNATRKTTLLKSIRLATVDNFQGEEAKVLVISLVRGNAERRCGFLSTPNRINVLLSRAKHGMYVIGNTDTYGHVPMWASVIGMLKEGGNIGPALQLCCPRHPDDPIEASTPDHFLQFSPEGGCNRPCDQRLECGHACINRCHSQNLHNAVKCLVPCPRLKKGCSHSCKRPCGEVCEPRCTERLKNLHIVLECGHIKTTALCWQAQDPSSILCTEPTTKTVPGCNHSVVVFCRINVAAEGYTCTSRCGDPQLCGHACQSECYRCKEREGGAIKAEHHPVCRQLCGRGYTACSHTCHKPCHGTEPCPSCPSPCESRCSHSKCSKKCHEPCAPCAQQTCASACTHQRCTMPCAAPCDWVPCSRRCEKLLGCGHQCPSICGEACPSNKYCQVCCGEETKNMDVDLIMGMQYHEIDLDEDPVIIPDCGHLLTKTSMDGVMDLKAYYQMSKDDDNPNPIALSSSSMPFSMKEVKKCPQCRGSLRNIARYGRIIRRAILDEATKRFISWSHGEYLKLAEQLVDIQIKLQNTTAPPVRLSMITPSNTSIITRSSSRLEHLIKIREWVGDLRYAEAIKFLREIHTFTKQVQREEQPLQRVADFVQYAMREKQAKEGFTFDESLIQTKGALQASALFLKCESAVFVDFLVIRQPLIATRPEFTMQPTQQMKDCENLIEMAQAARYPREEVEGHIYYARFCAITRILGAAATDKESEERRVSTLTEQATSHVTAAQQLLNKHAHLVESFSPEIEATEKMLRGEVFYNKVSEAELRAVYQAMSGEFRGTGHWYTCENGHPFTVGECGMPMQQARCPECNAHVGGANHMPAQGVRRATEIDELARETERLRI